MIDVENYTTNIHYRNEYLNVTENGNYFNFAICFMKLDVSIIEIMELDMKIHLDIDLFSLVPRGSYLPSTLQKVGRMLFVLNKKGKSIYTETFSTTFTDAEYALNNDFTKVNPYRFSVVEKEGVYYFVFEAKKKLNNPLLYANVKNYQSQMFPNCLFIYDTTTNHENYRSDLLEEQIIDINSNDYRKVSYNNFAGENMMLSETDSYGRLPEKGVGYILDQNNSNKIVIRINDKYYLIPMCYLGSDLSKIPANTVANGSIPVLEASSVGFSAFHRSYGRPVWWNGNSFKEANGADVGSNTSATQVILTGSILTNAACTYDKWGKQVAISGSLTFETANTDVAINLPFAPDFGCSINIGNLTFTLNSGSTTASVKSSITGAQGFQIHYKTA